MLEKLIKFRSENNFLIILPNSLLFLYLLTYPLLVHELFAFGALFVIPVIIFGFFKKLYGIIVGLLAFPINTILEVMFLEKDLLVSAIDMILPSLLVFLIGLIFGSYVELLDDKINLLSNLQSKEAEVNKLRKLVPICMYCKKIKDHDGYWQRVEKYIQEISSSSLSHGVCDDCLERKLGS